MAVIMGGALIDAGTSVGVWDKSAEDCGLNSPMMHLVDFTRFSRHISTSSSKSLECQRTQLVWAAVPADSIVKTFNVIKHV